MLKFALVATVYNEQNTILNFLNAIKSQTQQVDEIIILDGGSTDATPVLIKKFQLENQHLHIILIIDPTCSSSYSPGPIAKGRNFAIQRATSDILLVTDAGCILDPQWVSKISRPFIENSSTQVVSGFYRSTSKNKFQNLYERALMPKESALFRDDFLPSSRSMAFTKTAWNQVGGYPEETFAGEDTAFCLKLKCAGFKFTAAPSALVLWDCPKDYSELWSKHFIYGYGEGRQGIQKLKFCLRLVLLLFPYRILLRTFEGGFVIGYLSLFSHQVGYMRGYLNRIRA